MEAVVGHGPYHPSICQRSRVTDDGLAALRARWDGVGVVLPIRAVTGEGCMELADCPLTADDVFRQRYFHDDAWYWNRPFHISG